VAPVVAQDNVDDWPAAILEGEAEKARMIGVGPDAVVAEAVVEDAEVLPTLSLAVT